MDLESGKTGLNAASAFQLSCGFLIYETEPTVSTSELRGLNKWEEVLKVQVWCVAQNCSGNYYVNDGCSGKEKGKVRGQAPLSMEFSRKEYWSGLPIPSPGSLPDPGTEPGSPALQAGSLVFKPPACSGRRMVLRSLKGSPVWRLGVSHSFLLNCTYCGGLCI